MYAITCFMSTIIFLSKLVIVIDSLDHQKIMKFHFLILGTSLTQKGWDFPGLIPCLLWAIFQIKAEIHAIQKSTL